MSRGHDSAIIEFAHGKYDQPRDSPLQGLGITVYLHWTWFLAVPLALTYGKEVFQSTTWQIWSIAAYLLLFAIVLLHEFGHALACRSVGGKAERILLWPLGGL